MIASSDFRYTTPRDLSPWPATVRERAGRPDVAVGSHGVTPSSNGVPSGAGDDGNEAAPCTIPAPLDPGTAEDGDDELFLLGERIAELAARINSAEARMMTLIADFDRRGGWSGEFSSCAEWLAWRIGIKIGPARERVRAARALAGLPQTAEALREGRISYAKVRALTRVAKPESEGELLELAQAGSAAKLERTVRLLRKLSRDGELTAEQARHRSRAFSVFVDGDGMYVVKGRLEPEAGAVLMRAVEAASDALFRREPGAGDERGVGDARPKPEQRRADAVGLLAERALAAGFGGGECRDAHGDFRDSVHDSRASDALRDNGLADSGGGMGGSDGLRITESDAASRDDAVASVRGEAVAAADGDSKSARVAKSRVESGTRAERYQVMVHCDAATLAEEGEPGRSDLDGIRVSAETSRRMACDAAVVAMVHAKDGSVLSVGRRTRTIPPHIRRALEERDRGCRFPGCAGRFTEAHHVKHWADGGETSLRNTVLLCRRHHRTVHEGRVKVGKSPDGTVLFFTSKGRILADAPSMRRAPAVAMVGRVRADARMERARADASRPGVQAGSRMSPKSVPARLPPVPSAHAGARSMGDRTALSNGAALYRDSAIPWEIEVAAREAVEDALEL